VIVCDCRKISDSDYDNEEDLKARIMEEDFNCGQCQIKHIFEAQIEADKKELEELEELGLMNDGRDAVENYIKQKEK